MLIDRQNQFCISQAFTATAISENVIDLGPLGGLTANTIRDIGAGKPLYLHIGILEQVTTATGDTSTVFTLESSAATGLSASNVHWTSPALAKATMAPGYYVAKGVALPSGDYLRYLGLRATISTQNWNGGKVIAWLSENRFDDRQYRSGFSTGVN
jgi:hypothetical protein